MCAQLHNAAVDVIVTAHNMESCIGACLDSLERQTFESLCVVVVEDGSTDGTAAIAQDFAARHARFSVISTGGRGAGGARNRGMQEVRAPYFMILDGDDVFHPDMVEALYRAAIDGGADIAICDMQEMDDATGALTHPLWALKQSQLPAEGAFNGWRGMDGNIFADEVNFEQEWLDDARRYYTNIVGKYGTPVQNVLKKAAGLDIQYLCPLHGPVWRKNIGWFLEKYKRWSTYTPEAWTAAIFCGSIYGHTENACEILASRLAEKGVRHVRIFDVSHTDVSEQVSAAFQCSHLVFASATYNGGIYTPMETLLLELKAHALQNRTVALIENGSWGPAAARLMAKHLEEMKGMEQIAPPITIRSAVKEEQYRKLEELADLIAADIAAEE